MTDPCPQTDPVLACFLDGAPAASADLTAHLADCPACQASLRRARRLDALLAQTADHRVTDQLADRWLTAALPAPRQPRRSRLVVASLLLLGVGFALGSLLPWSRPTDQGGIARRSPQEAAAGPSLILPLPDAGRRRVMPGRRRGLGHRLEHDPASILGDENLAAELYPGLLIAQGLCDLSAPQAGALLLTLGRARVGAEQMATALRRAAGDRLLRSRRAGDRRQLRSFLATAPDGPVLHALIQLGRGDPSLRRQLQRSLRTPEPRAENIVLAARLGTKQLDETLARLGAGCEATATLIADAVIGLDQRQGRVALLLDLWRRMRARQQLDAAAERHIEDWFCRLPQAATAELLARARATRHPDRKHDCLRALAWRGDPAALDHLLEAVDGRHHEISLAAGFALSRLPRAAVETSLEARVKRSRRPHVLLAALCSMGSTLPQTFLRRADLSEEELAFLDAGHFNASQFDIACALCRRRSLLSD